MTISGYTANYRLRKVSFNSRGYHTDEWYNLDLIDGLLDGLASSVPFAVAAGTVDAITLDFTPNITYATGQQISFTASGANTGAVTVNCDGLGAKDLKKADGSAYEAGDISTGMYIRAIYNGTDFTTIFPSLSGLSNIVTTGAGSGVTAATDADDFVVDSAQANNGFSLLGPNGGVTKINFGRVSDNDAGQLKYDHGSNKLTLRTSGTDRASLDDSGIFQDSRPYVVAYRTYGTVAFAASGTVIDNWTVVGSEEDNFVKATGLFTAPVAGYYEIELQWIGTASAAVSHTFNLYVNGILATFHTQSLVVPLTTTQMSIRYGGLLQLAVGEVLALRIQTNGGASNFTGVVYMRIKLHHKTGI
jgi:hypothetical protein